MSDDDGQKHLSARDIELWEMIKRTVAQKPAANRPAKARRATSANKAKEKQARSQPEGGRATAEHTQSQRKQSQPAKKTIKSKAGDISAEAAEHPLNATANAKRRARTAPPTPSREDFAAMLDGTSPPRPKATAQKPKTKTAKNPPPSYQPHNAPSPKAKKPVQGFAKREVRNVSSGKQTIEAAIDLHGLTQREAETALKTFIKRAHNDGKRLALVITGKGQRRHARDRGFEYGEPEPGVLRRNVPLWLDDMPTEVISYGPAHKKHGGDGALYVKLRRRKNK